ncbi:MAG: aldo/keto reductase, partial [Microvirga sp.]
QIAIAWVAAQGDDIIPLVGARRRDRLAEALGTLDVKLTEEDLAAIERIVPKGAAAGDRYPSAQMAMLDSERVCGGVRNLTAERMSYVTTIGVSFIVSSLSWAAS